MAETVYLFTIKKQVQNAMIAYKKKQLKQLTENFMEVNEKKHTNKNGASYLYLRYGFLGAALSCSKVLTVYSVLLRAAL